MAIIIGADGAGNKLKDVVKDFLVGENFEVVDVTKEGQDFVDVTLAVAKLKSNKQRTILVLSLMLMGLARSWSRLKSKAWLQQKYQMSVQLT